MEKIPFIILKTQNSWKEEDPRKSTSNASCKHILFDYIYINFLYFAVNNYCSMICSQCALFFNFPCTTYLEEHTTETLRISTGVWWLPTLRWKWSRMTISPSHGWKKAFLILLYRMSTLSPRMDVKRKPGQIKQNHAQFNSNQFMVTWTQYIHVAFTENLSFTLDKKTSIHFLLKIFFKTTQKSTFK